MALYADLVPVYPAGQAVASFGQSNAGLAAAGTNLATATPIRVSNTIVTGATGATGVALPMMAPGESLTIFNNSASSLLIYPPATVAISITGSGMGTAGVALTLTTFRGSTIRAYSATQYTAT